MSDDKTLFFTRFTWTEIEEIHKAIQKSYEYDDLDIQGYLYSGGLPDNILQRFTNEQIDYLEEEQPKYFIDTAHILARGYHY